MMQIQTHDRINTTLCGVPESLEQGYAKLVLESTETMAVDEQGLVHGGFVFGLADHAVMLAVNHPNVVLGAAESRFLKPVRVNDRLVSEARITESSGKKRFVSVTVENDSGRVFEGQFTCFVLPQHVLET